MSVSPDIYLMRHGQTAWNLAGRLQGHMDSPLTATGVAQAEAYGRLLGRILPDPAQCRVVSSPLGRACRTAAIAVARMGADPAGVARDARLMEHAFGAWEGLTWAEIDDAFAASRAARQADKWGIPAPGGECYADVAARVADWLESLTPGAPVLAFSHGATARIVRGLYAGLGRDEMLKLSEPQDRIFRLAAGRIEEIIA